MNRLLIVTLAAPTVCLAQLAPDDVLARATVACTAAIKARLKDPASAEITPPVAGSLQKGQWFFSVGVNAKNSYGGYTGSNRWGCMVDPTSFKVTELFSPS